MYILGYSGLDNALAFRKKTFTNLSEREYRICQGMDAAAVLLYEGEVVAAAAEERFNCEVHTGKFPLNAINYCLTEAGIAINDVNAVCHGFNYSLIEELLQLDPQTQRLYREVYNPLEQHALFQKNFPTMNIEKLFLSIRHHDAHAASTYYPSGMKNALVLIVDGLGEADSISVYHGYGQQLNNIARYDLFSSLGMFYSIVTYHLGFEPNNDEYKVMGLAPYGNPNRFRSFFESCIDLKTDGEIYVPVFYKNTSYLEKQTYSGLRAWLADALIPPREKDEEIKQIHKDIAAGLQHMLNKALLHITSYWQQRTQTSQLCMAGGVALNCTANGMLLNSGLFKNIYVQPAAGDDGTALGAALYKHHVIDQQPVKIPASALPFYGPAFTNEQILAELQLHTDVVFNYYSETSLLDAAVNLLLEGKVIAWMQGRMEYGPRALGNRSILADPRREEMKEKINRAVKKREEFRPFAPSVKKDKAHLYFSISEQHELPYMLFTVPVKPEHQSALPAITHIDGSARVQTVDKKTHLLYWQLLDKFEQQSGYPILLNTSFNVKGQPIVCNPRDAILTLLATQIDALFIGNYLVTKNV